MTELLAAAAAAAVFGLLALIQLVVGAKRPLRSAAGAVLLGLLALFAVDVTGLFTGVSLPVSPLSLGIAGAAGIPGVTLMLLLDLILK